MRQFNFGPTTKKNFINFNRIYSSESHYTTLRLRTLVDRTAAFIGYSFRMELAHSNVHTMSAGRKSEKTAATSRNRRSRRFIKWLAKRLQEINLKTIGRAKLFAIGEADPIFMADWMANPLIQSDQPVTINLLLVFNQHLIRVRCLCRSLCFAQCSLKLHTNCAFSL